MPRRKSLIVPFSPHVNTREISERCGLKPCSSSMNQFWRECDPSTIRGIRSGFATTRRRPPRKARKCRKGSVPIWTRTHFTRAVLIELNSIIEWTNFREADTGTRYHESFCFIQLYTQLNQNRMASCTGKRPDKSYACGSPLLKCKKCGNVGCDKPQSGGCTGQGFISGSCGKCRSSDKSSF